MWTVPSGRCPSSVVVGPTDWLPLQAARLARAAAAARAPRRGRKRTGRAAEVFGISNFFVLDVQRLDRCPPRSSRGANHQDITQRSCRNESESDRRRRMSVSRAGGRGAGVIPPFMPYRRHLECASDAANSVIASAKRRAIIPPYGSPSIVGITHPARGRSSRYVRPSAVDHVQLAGGAVAEHHHAWSARSIRMTASPTGGGDLGGLVGDHRRVGRAGRRSAPAVQPGLGSPGAGRIAAPPPGGRGWRGRARAR